MSSDAFPFSSRAGRVLGSHPVEPPYFKVEEPSAPRGLPEITHLPPPCGSGAHTLGNGRGVTASQHVGCPSAPEDCLWALGLGLIQHLREPPGVASQYFVCSLGFKSNEMEMQAGPASWVCSLGGPCSEEPHTWVHALLSPSWIS